MSVKPYADAAADYQRLGWSPVPLPRGRKKAPPTGWTGYAAPYASGADVHEWASNGHGSGNVGLRTPETVLGLDLDAYDGKPGLATMLAAVERLGPLPPSPRSTSRPDDPVSGIRFYRVPAGRCWADTLGGEGSAVEVIHYGHRYAVAAPSLHPEGRVYGWYAPDGSPLATPPAVDDLPDLPPAWVADLDAGDVSARTVKATLRDDQVTSWLDDLPGRPEAPPCRYVARLIDELAEALAGKASRHDTTRNYVAKMIRAGDQGHVGVVTAVDTAESLLKAERALSDPLEVERMIAGAVALCVADPTSTLDKGCCAPEPVTLPESPAPVSPVPERATDEDTEAALDAAHALAVEVEREAYKLRVREAAREKVTAERAAVATLPSLTRLDAFLAVPDEEVTHRVEGLWPSGGRVVFSAPHKSGKTTATGNLARCLVDGEPFLDRFTVAPAARVVLLDNELDEGMLRRWLRDQGIANTTAIELVALRGRLSTFDILDPAIRERWAAHIGAADVLLFDCLRPALDALGLSEDKDAGRFLEALDELTTAAVIAETVIVHHMGHNGERSRGDSRILDWPDAIWKLVKDAAAEDGADDPGDRRVYFSAYGRDVDQPETLLTFDPATRRLSATGGSRNQTRAETVLASVLAFLADSPDSSKNAIESAVKGRRDVIRKAVALGVEQQLIVRFKSGQAHLHRLTSPTSPNLAPASGRTPLQDLAPSPIGRGRGRSAGQTEQDTSPRGEVATCERAECDRPNPDHPAPTARRAGTARPTTKGPPDGLPRYRCTRAAHRPQTLPEPRGHRRRMPRRVLAGRPPVLLRLPARPRHGRRHTRCHVGTVRPPRGPPASAPPTERPQRSDPRPWPASWWPEDSPPR